MNKPAIICAAGEHTGAVLDNILQGKVCVRKNSEYSSKAFFLGKCENLPKLPSNVRTPLITRTNAIVYGALLQMLDIINALKAYKNLQWGVVIGTTTTGVEENYQSFFGDSMNVSAVGANASADCAKTNANAVKADFSADCASADSIGANVARKDSSADSINIDSMSANIGANIVMPPPPHQILIIQPLKYPLINLSLMAILKSVLA